MIASRLTELRTLTDSGAPTLKRAEAVQIIRELCDEVQKLQRRREAAKGPKDHECITYGAIIGLSMDQAMKFFDYHSAKGWMMGRAPMRDFKAAMRFWKRNCSPVDGKKPSTAAPERWTEFVGENFPLYLGDYSHAPEYMKLDFGRWKKTAKA